MKKILYRFKDTGISSYYVGYVAETLMQNKLGNHEIVHLARICNNYNYGEWYNVAELDIIFFPETELATGTGGNSEKSTL